MHTTVRRVALFLGALAFCLLALLNVGGYRYGVSDQAFYIPIVLQGLEPGLFPHDAALLAVQNRLLAFDDWFAPLVRLSGQSLPVAFFAAYLAGLALLYAACVVLGRSLYRTWWGVAALAAALTLRHRIPDTAVNSIEAYLHPRQLAFAVGLLAAGLFLRGRTAGAAAAVAGACLFHPTTALWFVMLVGVAGLVADPAARRPILIVVAALLPVTVVLLVGGFREQLDVMSPSWSTLLESKDYLLATQWPMMTWFANLGLAAIIAAVYDYRLSLGMATCRETGIVAGCLVLLALFLVSVPLASIGVALVVQLQFSRIFWLLDVVAIAYAAWLVVESPLAVRGRGLLRSTAARLLQPRVRRAAIALIVLASLTRGSYVTFVERAGHPLIEIRPAGVGVDRGDAMGRRTPRGHQLPDRPGACLALRIERPGGQQPRRLPRIGQGHRHRHILEGHRRTHQQPHRRARRLRGARGGPCALARQTPRPRLSHHGARYRPAAGAPERSVRGVRSARRRPDGAARSPERRGLNRRSRTWTSLVSSSRPAVSTAGTG